MLRVRGFFMLQSWRFFRSFFVALVLGKVYAYSPKQSSDLTKFEKIQGATRSGATGLRASERQICL